MPKTQWISTKFPGIRYREHPTRKHGLKPDRYYVIRYWDRAGKRREEGVGWSSDGWTPVRVEDHLAEIRRNIAAGVGHQSLKERRAATAAAATQASVQALANTARRMTFGELVERYLSANSHKGEHQNERAWLRKWAVQRLGDYPLDSLKRKDVLAFRDYLIDDSGLAPASMRHILQTMHRVYRWAALTYLDESETIPLFDGANPAAEIPLETKTGKRVHIRNSRVEIFQDFEAEALLDATGGQYRNELHDACYLSWHTGLRRGEITSLLRRHIDIRHSAIHLTADMTKNGDDAYVPLNEEILPILDRRCRGLSGDSHVFPVSPGWITHCFVLICGRLGINDGVTDRLKKRGFHTWRHTYASNLAKAGTDILLLQRLMRHKTLAMTLRYVHFMPGHLRAEVARLVRKKQRHHAA